MKGVHLAVLLTICMHVFLVTGIEGPQCFHFTWPGTQIQDKNELNCTEFTPCIEPLYIKDTEPNTNEIWDEKVIKKNDFTYIKRMDRGNVCVKFTYIYNKAVGKSQKIERRSHQAVMFNILMDIVSKYAPVTLKTELNPVTRQLEIHIQH
ncbi:uncharacterized protein LOC105831706 isoform X2 [Monomorium pharaonis]|uniref:uncharacterized protein LOC105831706 isoform X2 n=1 Tax=Monomorium pharaonis TaxID=307658 RepID=UPI00063EE384|nr:uncharacterized protein LOC105831706 isoform X2 [Monomorium pharaonis]